MVILIRGKTKILFEIGEDEKREWRLYADALKKNLSETIRFAMRQMMDSDKTYQLIKEEHEQRQQFYEEIRGARGGNEMISLHGSELLNSRESDE
jgi:hypothetical protein